MSAFIVATEHIDVIVQAAATARYGVRFRNQLGEWQDTSELGVDAIGQLLLAENYASVNYRYNEDEQVPEYDYRRPSRPFTAIEVLKAIACLEYQSCEHGEWEASDAHSLLTALTASLIPTLPGYDAAAWAIDSRTMASA